MGTAQATNYAPVLSVSGHTLSWTATAPKGHYYLEAKPGGTVKIDATSYAPPEQVGITVTYRVRPARCKCWSNEVSISYGESQAEREAREKREREELEAKEKAEREQREKEEREREEKEQLGRPHVMVVVEENRNRGEVVGDPNMPYFNGLLQKYGNTTNWHGVTHPSLPNYLALASGSTQGVTDDGCSYSFSGQTIASQLTTAGIPWKAYMEGLPSAGSTTCTSGNYAKKHNPFAYFTTSNGANVVPASQFSASSLPPFAWYTPDLCNDGHDCANATVDASLKAIIAPVLTSGWYAENGTIIVTWDEDEGEGKIATIVLHGPGYKSTLTTAGNHYGTLATIEDIYGVARLGGAVGATTLSPLLEAPKEEPPPGTAGDVKWREDAKSYFDTSSGQTAFINEHFAAILGYGSFAWSHYASLSPVLLCYRDAYTKWPDKLNPTHRAEMVAQVQEDISHGCDGSFQDDVEWSGSGQHIAGTDEEMALMLEAIRQAIGPGKILALNTQYADLKSRITSNPYVVRALAVTNQIDKEFGVNSGSGINSPTNFAEYLAYVDALHGKGIHVEQEDVESQEPTGTEYGLATYLLINDGGDYTGAYSTPSTWSPAFDTNIGAATGPREAVGGVYRRKFVGATVYVDPPGGPTTTLDGHALSARQGIISK